MDNQIINNKDTLNTLINHAKYLYEEETKRTERFNNAVKTYILFTSSTFAVIIGAVKWLKIDLSTLYKSNQISLRDLVISCIFEISIFLTTISFILTVSVIKTWRTERLCNPRMFYTQASNLTDEKHILHRILIDFLVSTEINAKVNDEKCKLLSSAAKTHFFGIMLLMVALIIYIHT